MESSNFVMALVTTFIGAAILLGVGIQVLGNVEVSTNCLSLPGGLTGTANTQGSNNVTQATATGWAKSCFDNNTSIQGAYALLLVIMIVIAAVAILAVVKLL